MAITVVLRRYWNRQGVGLPPWLDRCAGLSRFLAVELSLPAAGVLALPSATLSHAIVVQSCAATHISARRIRTRVRIPSDRIAQSTWVGKRSQPCRSLHM